MRGRAAIAQLVERKLPKRREAARGGQETAEATGDSDVHDGARAIAHFGSDRGRSGRLRATLPDREGGLVGDADAAWRRLDELRALADYPAALREAIGELDRDAIDELA